MFVFELLDWHEIPWDELDRFKDRNIFQTRSWLQFLSETQSARPVVARITCTDGCIGYVTGLIVSKMGVRIFASPFKGWTTAYMGFNVQPGYARSEVSKAFSSFVFKNLGCHHFEMTDRNLRAEDCTGLSYQVRFYKTYELDLAQSEEELFAHMDSACRRCIRKADKCGVVIEEADAEGFAGEYYAQLREVFGKQNLTPTYGIDRVRQLIKHVHPTGNLLLLRARDDQGRSIATGIFPGLNDTAYFWGGASWREYQILRPNEAIFWYAMRYWKSRGAGRLDLGGLGAYKEKYGCSMIQVPHLIKSKYRIVTALRDVAQNLWKVQKKIQGKFRTSALGHPRVEN